MRVDVWLARLDGPETEATALRSACVPDEHARAGRFRSPELGARWLAGRGVLRSVLGRALGVAPEGIAFGQTAAGKPVLVVGDVHFNLSHSGSLVAVAVAGRPVGVDIEVDRRLVRPERLAARLFDNPGEHDSWSTTPEPARTRILLGRWTRTEALLKATGDGVAGGIVAAEARLREAGWDVRDLALGDGVTGAVAAYGSDWDLAGPLAFHAAPTGGETPFGPTG